MPIRLRINVLMAERNVTARDLAARIGLSETQMSLLRTSKVKGLRFDTLARLCYVLGCKPGDLIDYEVDEGDMSPDSGPLTPNKEGAPVIVAPLIRTNAASSNT